MGTAPFLFPDQGDRWRLRELSHAWHRVPPQNAQVTIEPSGAMPRTPTTFTIRVRPAGSWPEGTHLLVFVPFKLTEHALCADAAPGRDTVVTVAAEGAACRNRLTAAGNCGVIESILDAPGMDAGAALAITLGALLVRDRPGRRALELYVKLPGGGFAPVACDACIETLPAPAESLQVYARPTCNGGEFSFTVAAEQPASHGYLPDRGYRGTVTVRLPGATFDYEFTPEDGGAHTFNDVPVDTTRRFRVQARDERNGFAAESNTVDSGFAPPGFDIYFGDLHLHSEESDGYGSQEEILALARDWKRLDFIALNEHCEQGLAPREWTPQKWARIREAFDAAYRPGSFVTIGGFEFHSFINLWCSDDEYTDFILDYWGRDIGEVFDRLAEFTRKDNWLAGYHAVDTLYGEHGDRLVPVHLLQLAHGDRPTEDGLWPFLTRGDRVGFFGATDSHSGLPGGVAPGRPRSARSGLTAIIARELSREGIFEALRARRCYATCGTRHLVRFELAGQPMGSEVALPAGEPRRITLSVAGDEPIRSVDIVRNGVNLRTFAVGGAEIEIEHSDTDALAGEACYFTRTTLEDGRMIWTSPVWTSFGE